MADSEGKIQNGEAPPEKANTEQPASSDDEQTKATDDEQTKAMALLADKIEELAALPEKERRNAITSFVSHTRIESIRSGPMPSAGEMVKYKEVQADLPDRIVRMAEIEQQHRHDVQKAVIANERHKVNAALAVAISIVVVAGLATWLGRGWIAVPLGLAGIAATILRHFLMDRGSGSNRRRPRDADSSQED